MRIAHSVSDRESAAMAFWEVSPMSTMRRTELIDRLPAPAEASLDQLEEIARGSQKLAARLNGKEIVKAIVVPGKLVNFVAR